MIELDKVVFKRGNRIILEQVSFSIPQGNITAIMGPSGTGKTTILNLITGQLKPDSGAIYMFGERVDKMTERQLTFLRKRMSMLFQSGALFTDMNVFDNVAFPLYENTNLEDRLIRQVVLLKLDLVGLRGAAKLMPNELSGGMRRRIALARSIALDPELLFYDEPFAGQDPIAMGMLVYLIKRLNDILNLSTIIVSHDIVETMSISDKILIFSEGNLIINGSPDQLKESESKWVQQFICAKSDGPVPFHFPSKPYFDELMEDV